MVKRVEFGERISKRIKIEVGIRPIGLFRIGIAAGREGVSRLAGGEEEEGKKGQAADHVVMMRSLPDSTNFMRS